MQHKQHHDLLVGRIIWVLRLQNRFDNQQTLLLSKVSEAIQPSSLHNHIGEGSTLDTFIRAQPNVRFVINGGFNHSRKDFYAWPHQDYQIGDPVGLVKIRDHYFEDQLAPKFYGYFVQKERGLPWSIVTGEQLDKTSKYILGCTPLLLRAGQPTAIPRESLAPLPAGQINPPSVLGHGLQRHPRTAVGVHGPDLYFIVVEGGPGQGCTLPELQKVGVILGLDSLLSLDGGGSTQFRLRSPSGWLRNYVAPEDTQRTLGNVIALFDSPRAG